MRDAGSIRRHGTLPVNRCHGGTQQLDSASPRSQCEVPACHEVPPPTSSLTGHLFPREQQSRDPQVAIYCKTMGGRQ
jgi:hypothetical protein